jgi:UDP-hydrolysing UDP-N-acetyl-D-glucosamine 2-epimerase
MRIGLLSTGRQDWGILRSTYLALRADRMHFDVRVLLGGMACSERFGRLDRMLEAEGVTIHEALPWVNEAPHEPLAPAVTHEAALALERVGAALGRQALDALVLVGDRYETLAAALAATLRLVPIVHFHGGEETEGAFDNAIRHAISKLAHLHFVSHPTYAARLRAMGEAAGAVHVVGAPGLDNLRRSDLADRAELMAHLGIELEAPVVVVTMHPATLGSGAEAELASVVGAMRAVPATYVVTLPNADPGNELIRDAFRTLADLPRVVTVEALGERRYLGLLRIADAMLGNSSSGVIEAPALKLPVVNVGDRQKGRLRSAGILDVTGTIADVKATLVRAISPVFRAEVAAQPAPFGEGNAAEHIAAVLRAWTPPRPPVKRFHGETS